MREAVGFPVRTAGYFSGRLVERALDLGCAVGRSAFELSRNCGHVTGIDFSQGFVTAAEKLRQGGELAYGRREEATLSTPLTARLPVGVDGAKLGFLQGDAMDLPPEIGAFDQVHAANLLCRLTEPQRLLDRLPELVKPGGELVLATPCTWLEEFTPLTNWPASSTFDWLHNKLSPAFTLLRSADEPFLIRETARKFQWSLSMVTVWRRQA